jgi:hypothetical protein
MDEQTGTATRTHNTSGDHLYFFWDYDIDEEEVLRILRQGTPTEKAWVITRILEYAKWDDIWRYLSLSDIRENLEHLRFRRPQDRELWAYALERWTSGG